ncbi:hypothetical protein QU487_06260 [Crenobacter sp. SG2305]|uniref:hypothetical protein n=1 Tax=Crenobacter oryzisoli TaxID=3056844 RepID=UPI0025AABB4C|nr:hypothetical protein [Crenobacter sp. SG2305]MDN0082355.1 hypothetical protein [Crenobacter sp. SG2305]
MLGKLFGREQGIPKYANHIHNEVTWDDTELQFARLVCEMSALINQKTLDKVAARMALPSHTLQGLLQRASAMWTDALSRTDQNGYYPTVETRQYRLEEMALYDPVAQPTVEQLQNPAPHLVTLEFNPVEGGAMLAIEPERINRLRNGYISVVATVQNGRGELFVSTVQEDCLRIGLGEDGLLKLYPPQEDEGAEGATTALSA